MGDVDLVGQQVLGLAVARGLDPRLIFGLVVAHHRRRRFVEALDLEARLVPDRQADRAERAWSCPASRSQSSAVAISAAAASPSSASKMPHWPMPLPICSCTSSSTCALIRPTTLPPRSASQNCGPGMLEPRVLARRDEAVDLVLQRRHPGGVVLVNLPGEVDEGLLVLLGLDGADGDGRAAHGARASGCQRGRAPVKPYNRPIRATISCQRTSFSKDHDQHRDPRALRPTLLPAQRAPRAPRTMRRCSRRRRT